MVVGCVSSAKSSGPVGWAPTHRQLTWSVNAPPNKGSAPEPGTSQPSGRKRPPTESRVAHRSRTRLLGRGTGQRGWTSTTVKAAYLRRRRRRDRGVLAGPRDGLPQRLHGRRVDVSAGTTGREVSESDELMLRTETKMPAAPHPANARAKMSISTFLSHEDACQSTPFKRRRSGVQTHTATAQRSEPISKTVMAKM